MSRWSNVLVALGLGCALTLAGGCDSEPDSPADAVDQAADSVEDGAEELKDGAEGVVEGTQDAAGELGNEVEGAME